MKPTPQEIYAAMTPRGGWTRNQLAKWDVPWPPPKGWKKRLLRQCEVTAGQAETDPPAAKQLGAMDGM